MKDVAAPSIGSPALPAPLLQALAARLALTLLGLRAAVAAWGGRERAAVPLVVLAWARIGRLGARFVALLARVGAGETPPVPRVRQARVRADGAAPGLLLPRGFGWLGQMLPEARGFGLQLQALLEDPAMAALLAADRRVGRVLRPLGWMLGVVLPGTKARAVRTPRLVAAALVARATGRAAARRPEEWRDDAPARWPRAWLLG